MVSLPDCKVPAAILAISTANPPNCIYQDNYPDYYFRVMETGHLTNVKAKFARICKQSGIRKRQFLLTEEPLKRIPAICSYDAASLDQRQDLVIDMHPKLAMQAADKAIAEWGQPKSAITHLIFCSMTGMATPGADMQLLKLLDLPPSVNRLMLYRLGCHAGGTLLRLAKDIAENNPGARILRVCVETTVAWFRALAPEGDPVYLVGNAIFGDGASAVIVGSPPPTLAVERRLFEIISASQTTVPASDEAVGGQYHTIGTTMRLSPELPKFGSFHLEACLVEAFGQSNIVVDDWNSIFWAIYPGERKILDNAEAKFELRKERLRAARRVLEGHGNMSSARVVFILDEMGKKSAEEGKSTTCERLEWGVLLGFGPGITIETGFTKFASIPQLRCESRQVFQNINRSVRLLTSFYFR